ncbi:MAG: phenylalanine--tRNA ligase subunit beta [Thiovulaceae bacterium]|nr:phenylalanine--tRNA ligase subunit beta [Sulfurimonadaceae bacterium]
MIVTKSWLNEWIDINDVSTDDLCKTFNSIGLEVDRIVNYDIPNKIIFGKVIECEQHPDADKLSVCKVDIGTSIRQIVCGAANVRAGLDVIVATIGCVMPSDMVIKPVKLRGIESEGMICSATEIGLPDMGEGIMEIDNSIGSYQLGQEVNTHPIFSDDLIEIELTANRGDCLSIRGVARDLSAAYGNPVKKVVVKQNDDKRLGIGRILSLTHDNDYNVNLRYKAMDIKDLVLPFIVRLRLAQIEENRESDIMSLMLYVTHSSGVILRAYEHAFFQENEEKMAKIELVNDDKNFASIMTYDGKKASTVGIIQEDESKVCCSEGIVLLEASYIPPDVISKKMLDNKLESGPLYYRTSRGSEPELNKGLDFCISLVEANSSSTVYGGTIELCDNYEESIVTVTKSEIDEIIGAQIDKTRITKLLKNLGFNTSKSQGDSYVISIPRYRHDITNKQDIVEEIVRMVGIDNIKSKPFELKEENRLEDDYFWYKKRKIYRHKAASVGFFESIHFVFDEKKVLNEYGFETLEEKIDLINPIAKTLDTLRPTLLTGLLKAASLNAKNGFSSIRLFEIGSVFNVQRDESVKLSILFSGDTAKDNVQNCGKPQIVDFGFFAQKLSDIIGEFELIEYETSHNLSHKYQCASVMQNSKKVGELFRVHPNVEEAYDLDVTYMCELDFEKLAYGLKTATSKSKYQASQKDLSLIMPKSMSYSVVKKVISDVKPDEIVEFYPVDRYSDDDLGDNMSLTIRFALQRNDRTLEEEDITSSMEAILEALKKELDIGLR